MRLATELLPNAVRNISREKSGETIDQWVQRELMATANDLLENNVKSLPKGQMSTRTRTNLVNVATNF
jgi:hypothetical protein